MALYSFIIKLATQFLNYVVILNNSLYLKLNETFRVK